MSNFIEELKWRGMIHDMMPGTEEQFEKECTAAYIGFDPTADSLHIGSLVQIMILVHLQKSGHKPVALLGGATGMVGDPSGKSKERNLLDAHTLEKNLQGIKKQLALFLDFDCGEQSAEMVNNYDWFKDFNFLDFIRDVGKHISVNYMMAKDSVKSRLETGLSFTEFSYQLVQGYDFYWLWKNKNCKVQLGGSDQWGNIVTGTELIRRKGKGEAFACTTPLIKKADGTKFGKTAGGNVWLDAERTTPYQFYQYWINASDDDAINYIKIFTLKTKEEIDSIIVQHQEAPHLRFLQKELANDITARVHGHTALEEAINASKILFGKSSLEDLLTVSAASLESAFDEKNTFELSATEIKAGVPVLDLTTQTAAIFSSKGEAKRMIKQNGLSIKKEKVTDENAIISDEHLIHDKFLFIQKGKKFFLIKSV
jgi:tyrosyl-tRNA synthetase